MPDRRYEVRVTGRLSQHVRDAFAAMHITEITAETVIIGVVHDDEQLHELLSAVRSVGLQIVAVQRVGA